MASAERPFSYANGRKDILKWGTYLTSAKLDKAFLTLGYESTFSIEKPSAPSAQHTVASCASRLTNRRRTAGPGRQWKLDEGEDRCGQGWFGVVHCYRVDSLVHLRIEDTRQPSLSRRLWEEELALCRVKLAENDIVTPVGVRGPRRRRHSPSATNLKQHSRHPLLLRRHPPPRRPPPAARPAVSESRLLTPSRITLA